MCEMLASTYWSPARPRAQVTLTRCARHRVAPVTLFEGVEDSSERLEFIIILPKAAHSWITSAGFLNAEEWPGVDYRGL